MSKIKRHGIAASLFMFIGLIIGFVNGSVLFPRVAGAELFGFCMFILSMSNVIGIISIIGIPNTTIRYFPRFKDKANNHNGFLGLITGLVGVSTTITTIILILAKPLILYLFRNDDNVTQFEQYYWTVIVLFIISNVFSVFANYTSALQRPRFFVFLQNVVSRLIVFSLLMLLFFQWLTKDQFIQLYAFKAAPIALILILFVIYIKEFHLKINWEKYKGKDLKEMLTYGGFSFLSDVSGVLINRIDILMIAMLLGNVSTGVYSAFYFLSTVIQMPHAGMASIAKPIIAEHWENNRKAEIEHLYKKFAKNNYIPAVLVFIGIVVNLENAILLMGEDFRAGVWVAVFLGLSRLFNVLNGYNGLILIVSPLFKYDLVFRTLTITVTIISNVIFIPMYGIVGAALATMLTILISNLFSQIFLYYKYSIHPFSRSMVWTTLIGIVVFLVGFYLPRIELNFILDILVRSSLVTILFLGLILVFKISPDINKYCWNMAKRFGLSKLISSQ